LPQAKAIAYEIAAALGVNEAAKIMEDAARAVRNEQDYGSFRP
jgi:hypothetical protein